MEVRPWAITSEKQPGGMARNTRPLERPSWRP
nr:MAG TPA: hypothetical protein [Caudoviricetes sp.]